MATDIDAVIQELHRPFPLDVLQLRVGATNREKTSGMALAYVGWWRGYLPALNHYVGRRNWQIALSGPKGDTIARLTAFDGAVEAWSRGEEEPEHENQGTSSEIQAKRRVCAEGLGLGLYLYSLPKLWGAIEPLGRSYVFPREVEESLKRQLYAALGLDQIAPLVVHAPFAAFMPAVAPARDRAPAPPEPVAPPQGAPLRRAGPVSAPEPTQLSAARSALAEGERRAGMRPPTPAPAPDEAPGTPRAARPATEKQVHRIAGDLAAYAAEELRHFRAGIARVLGRPVAIGQMHDPAYVAALGLTSREASALIDCIAAIRAGLLARTA